MGLPTVSIVIPNFNGAAFIGRAIRSLVDQQYPGLEIIVIDGASRDNSVRVIREYARHLAYWESEKDRGQCHAINKGFARCTGAVVNWLCSDDILTPGALAKVGAAFSADPQLDVVVGAGRFEYLDKSGKPTREPFIQRTTQERIDLIPCWDPIAQPSCFYKRSLLDRPGPLLEEYHFAMDFELWAYFQSKGAKWRCMEDELSVSFNDGENKSSVGGVRIAREMEKIYRHYTRERISLMFWQRHVRNPLHCRVSAHPRSKNAWRWRAAFEKLDRILGRFYGIDRVKALDWRWCTMRQD